MRMRVTDSVYINFPLLMGLHSQFILKPNSPLKRENKNPNYHEDWKEKHNNEGRKRQVKKRKGNIKVCGQDPSEAQTAKDIQRPQLTWFDVSDSVFLLDPSLKISSLVIHLIICKFFLFFYFFLNVCMCVCMDDGRCT